MILHTALIALLLQTVAGGAAGTSSVSGTVVNGATGEPLPGVRVSLARTDMPLGAFSQMMRAGPARETTISADALTILKATIEAAELDAGAPPEITAQRAAIKTLPLDEILEVIMSPMSGAAVVTRSTPPTTTDERGRFAFNNVKPGTFRLVFASNGYMKQDYGQRTATGVGLPITLGAGQSKADIAVKMTPVGAVSGRIRDASGQPAVGVSVQLLRFPYDETGRKQAQRVAATMSDDRGEYRMFYLTPGRYYLSVGNQDGSTRGLIDPLLAPAYVSPNGTPPGYGVTYYPGVSDESAAGAIEVQPGADVRGIDMFVGPQKSFRVRGRVIDPESGRPPQGARVTVSQTEELLPSSMRSGNYNALDGTFTVENVIPGTYVATATVSNPGMSINFSALSPSERTVYFEQSTLAARAAPRASALVNIVNADVDGLVLTLAKSRPISGRFRIDTNVPNNSIQFALLFLQFATAGKSGRVFSTTDDPEFHRATADGSFRIDNVLPGEYQFSLQGLPPGFYLKEARFGDADALNGRMIVSSSSSDALEIVLSPNVGRISGETLGAAGQPVPGAQVVLIPIQKGERPELFRPVTADSTGRFTIPSITPGDYTLVAWDAIEPYAYFDPGLIAQAERGGKSVRVAESSSQTVNVPVVSADQR